MGILRSPSSSVRITRTCPPEDSQHIHEPSTAGLVLNSMSNKADARMQLRISKGEATEMAASYCRDPAFVGTAPSFLHPCRRNAAARLPGRMVVRSEMRFRPCIDLHAGKVKQIVGSTLVDAGKSPETNFESELPSTYFASRYKDDLLPGGHVIMLGPGNEVAAKEALAAFPGGLHVGGGINPSNALEYLEAGASHVIVTSFVFRDGKLDMDRLKQVVDVVGRERLVLDLSCRKRGDEYFVCTDRWQKWTELSLCKPTFELLAQYCDEILVHAVDVEGKKTGIDEELVALLAELSTVPVTYAGGARSVEDLERTRKVGNGKVDLTIGSALDIFGGSLSYEDAVRWQRQQELEQ